MRPQAETQPNVQANVQTNGLCSISPIGLVILSVVISLIIIEFLNKDQLNVVGNLFIGIGGILIIDASFADYLAGLATDQAQREMLQKQLDLLNRQKPASSNLLRFLSGKADNNR